MTKILYFTLFMLWTANLFSQSLCETAVPVYNGYEGHFILNGPQYSNYLRWADELYPINHPYVHTVPSRQRILLFSYVVQNVTDRIVVSLVGYGVSGYFFGECSENMGLVSFNDLHDQRLHSAGNGTGRNVLKMTPQCEHNIEVGQTVYFGFSAANDPRPVSFKVDIYPDEVCPRSDRPANDCEEAPMVCSQRYTGSTFCCYNSNYIDIYNDPSFCGHHRLPYSRFFGNSWIKIIPAHSEMEIDVRAFNNPWGISTNYSLLEGSCGSFRKIPEKCENEWGFTQGILSYRNVIPGNTYYLLFTKNNRTVSDFDLKFKNTVHTDNTRCADAQVLLCGEHVYNGFHCHQGGDDGVNCATGAPLRRGLWYSVAGTGAPMTVSTQNPGTTGNVILYVYEGDCVSSLSCVSGASPQGSRTVTFPTVCGQKYYVYVTTLTTADDILFELSATCEAHPCAGIIIQGPAAICKNETGIYTQQDGCAHGTWKVSPVSAGTIDEQGQLTVSGSYSGTLEVVYHIGTCQVTYPVTVSNLGMTGDIIHPTCEDNSGSIILSPLNPLYSYLWSHGPTNATATGLTDGEYSVTITDTTNGCEDVLSFVLKSPEPIPFAGIGDIINVCDTTTIPLILTEWFSIPPNISGQWYNFDVPISTTRFYDGVLDVYQMREGTYTLTHIVQNSCGSDTSSMVINVGPVKTAQVEPHVTMCNGGQGIYPSLLDLNTLIKSGDRTGQWTRMAGTAPLPPALPIVNFDGASAGTYSYRYTTSGCAPQSYIVTVVVEECGCLPLLIKKSDILCETETPIDLSKYTSNNITGQWDIVSGPTDYQSEIENGRFVMKDTAPQGYEIVFTADSPIAGCPDRDTLRIIIERQPKAGVGTSAVYCDTLSTLQNLNVWITDGDIGGFWTYNGADPLLFGALDTRTGLLDISMLNVGTYSFSYSVNSGLFCATDEAEVRIEIKECQCTMEVTVQKTDVSCPDGSDGTIVIDIASPEGTPNIIWSEAQWNGQSSISDIKAGRYSVTVTDAAQCTVTEEIEISQPEEIVIVCSPIGTSVKGAQDGSNTIEIQGGTPPYILRWAGPQTGEITDVVTQTELKDLRAGAYTLEGEDSRGCNIACTFVVADGDCILRVEAEIKDIVCYGENTGAITLNITNSSGGQPNIIWSDEAYNGQQNLTDLASGLYAVTVTDAGTGCQESRTFTLASPPKIDISADVTHTSCAEICNGKISITRDNVLDTQSTIEWSLPTEENTPLLSPLCPGEYSVTITITEGCVHEIKYMEIAVVDTVTLSILVEPEKVTSGELITLSLDTNLDPSMVSEIYWTSANILACNTCPQTTTTLEKSSEIKVEVTSMDGCQREATIWVQIETDKEIFVPNILSSNTSSNGGFYVQGRNIEKIDLMTIYNRWGNIMFEKKNIVPNDAQHSWIPQNTPAGVYVYMIQVAFSDGTQEIFTGDITVVR